MQRGIKGARLMNNQVESLKRDRARLVKEVEDLKIKLSLGRCGSCKKACEAGILNKRVCDPK